MLKILLSSIPKAHYKDFNFIDKASLCLNLESMKIDLHILKHSTLLF